LVKQFFFNSSIDWNNFYAKKNENDCGEVKKIVFLGKYHFGSLCIPLVSSFIAKREGECYAFFFHECVFLHNLMMNHAQ